MNAAIRKLAERLRTTNGLPPVAVGFDGFVDEMITVVGERQSLKKFTAVPDIATFGGLITKAAGHSSLREIVVNTVHPGGCAVNLGDGLAALGVPVDAFATLGCPVYPAFTGITSKFRSCHSWGKEPGRTLAFEFNDGKLMFSAVSQLADFTPAHVEKMLADGAYAKACEQARVIALTDWTLYPHMTAVWRLLQERVYSGLKQRPAFFIDLVDPTSRSAADIKAMLDTLPGFEKFGPLTLGLNGNEANVLARVLGMSPSANEPSAMLAQAEALGQKLKITEAVIHQPRFAVTADEKEPLSLNGPFCEKPKKSTGAGDRFNAGFVLGKLLELDAQGRLALGCAASGFFVRQARSATMVELADFLEKDFVA